MYIVFVHFTQSIAIAGLCLSRIYSLSQIKRDFECVQTKGRLDSVQRNARLNRKCNEEELERELFLLRINGFRLLRI